VTRQVRMFRFSLVARVVLWFSPSMTERGL